MNALIAELRRRNVLRVGAAYLVVSWLILQLIDVVFPMLGLDEALGRPVLVLLLLGLPVALILAWIFELTPEGIKKDKDVDRSQPAAEKARRLLDRAIIVILILTSGLLLVDKFVLQQQSAPQQSVVEALRLNSVAVLPFVNLSSDGDNEYFADGLTETLLHMLAQVPELKVAARTSATKSAMLTSTSWPTALMIGIRLVWIARATHSSLNAQRSSSDPPPRPRIITSMPPSVSLLALVILMASAISSAALGP